MLTFNPLNLKVNLKTSQKMNTKKAEGNSNKLVGKNYTQNKSNYTYIHPASQHYQLPHSRKAFYQTTMIIALIFSFVCVIILIINYMMINEITHDLRAILNTLLR